MEKILTVSIASYNVEAFLAETLESCVVSEIIDKLEVIVVNDGSTDETLKIANNYAEKYPDTFKVINKKNGGYGSTVNASIRIASGKYFKLLDGDDWFDKDELVAFVHILENANEDMIVSRFKRVFEEDGHIEERDEMHGINFETAHFEEIETKDWFTMHAITYKTEILQINNISLTEHCFYTDQEYDLLPLKWVDTVRFVPHSIYCYRIGRGEQSVSPAGIEKHYKEQTFVLKHLYTLFREELELSESKKDLYILKYLGRRTVIQVWNYILITKSNEHKKELKEFISYLKYNQPVVYKEVKNYKIIKAVVYSNYLLYGFLHNYKVRNYRF